MPVVIDEEWKDIIKEAPRSSKPTMERVCR